MTNQFKRNPDDYTGYYSLYFRPNGNVGVVNSRQYKDDITPLLLRDQVIKTESFEGDAIVPDNWKIICFEQDVPDARKRHFPDQPITKLGQIDEIVEIVSDNLKLYSGFQSYTGIGLNAHIGRDLATISIAPDESTYREIFGFYNCLQHNLSQAGFDDGHRNRRDFSWTTLQKPTPRNRSTKDAFKSSVVEFSKLKTRPISMVMVLSEALYSKEGDFVSDRPIVSFEMNGIAEWHCINPFDRSAKSSFLNRGRSGYTPGRCGSDKTKTTRYPQMI